MKDNRLKRFFSIVLIIIAIVIVLIYLGSNEKIADNEPSKDNVSEQVEEYVIEQKKDNEKEVEKKQSNKESSNRDNKNSPKKNDNNNTVKKKNKIIDTNNNESQKNTEKPKEKPVVEPEIKKYTITYKKSTNTKGEVPNVQKATAGQSVSLANNNTKEKTVLGTAYFSYCYNGCGGGYDFYLNSYKVYKSNGWSKSINSHNCEYRNGQTISVDNNIVLYACYSSTSEVEGVQFPSVTNPNGKEFNGWYTGQNCSKTKLNSYEGSQPMNFYACWK